MARPKKGKIEKNTPDSLTASDLNGLTDAELGALRSAALEPVEVEWSGRMATGHRGVRIPVPGEYRIAAGEALIKIKKRPPDLALLALIINEQARRAAVRSSQLVIPEELNIIEKNATRKKPEKPADK